MLTSFDIRALAIAGLTAAALWIAAATPGIAAEKSARPLSTSVASLKP